MTLVAHMNVLNQDGEAYCCLRNKVVSLNHLQILNYCSSCQMKQELKEDSYVSCVWDDVRDVQNPHIVTDPYMEYKAMQKRKTDTTQADSI